jgi:hypothetical protein
MKLLNIRIFLRKKIRAILNVGSATKKDHGRYNLEKIPKRLARKLRSANIEDYNQWLEGFVGNGGIPTYKYDYPFSYWDWFVATDDIEPVQLYGANSLNIIIPAGITAGKGNWGHCELFFMNGFTANSSVPIFVDTKFDEMGEHKAREKFNRSLAVAGICKSQRSSRDCRCSTNRLGECADCDGYVIIDESKEGEGIKKSGGCLRKTLLEFEKYWKYGKCSAFNKRPDGPLVIQASEVMTAIARANNVAECIDLSNAPFPEKQNP